MGSLSLWWQLTHHHPRTVVSGPRHEVEILSKTLKQRGIRTFRVATDIAFHHPMLTSLSLAMAKDLDGRISPCPPKMSFYSTSAEDPRSSCCHDAHYWTGNMTKPALLTSAVEAAARDGMQLFLEVSSHPVVSHSVQETLLTLGVGEFIMANTMARDTSPEKTILYSMVQLHCHGASIDWQKTMDGPWASDVPGTTWIHKPFYRRIETQSLPTSSITHDTNQHTLTGNRMPVADEKYCCLYNKARQGERTISWKSSGA